MLTLKNEWIPTEKLTDREFSTASPKVKEELLRDTCILNEITSQLDFLGFKNRNFSVQIILCSNKGKQMQLYPCNQQAEFR